MPAALTAVTFLRKTRRSRECFSMLASLKGDCKRLARGLPQGPQKRLSQERVAVPLHRLRPFPVVDFRALRFGPRFAVPADLFHVVVQLEGEAVGINGEGAVVDAG